MLLLCCCYAREGNFVNSNYSTLKKTQVQFLKRQLCIFRLRGQTLAEKICPFCPLASQSVLQTLANRTRPRQNIPGKRESRYPPSDALFHPFSPFGWKHQHHQVRQTVALYEGTLLPSPLRLPAFPLPSPTGWARRRRRRRRIPEARPQ